MLSGIANSGTTHHQELQFRSRGVARSFGKRAIGETYGLAVVLVLILVAGVVAAPAHFALAQRSLVDVQVFGPIEPAEPEGSGLRAQVRIEHGGDWHPHAETGLRPLSVVGRAAAQAESQTENAARDERRLVETCDGSSGRAPQRARHEFEVGTAGSTFRRLAITSTT
jgi:hypothetical protein